jgi:hypothetical protein
MEPGRDETSYVAAARSGSEEAWRHLVTAHQGGLLRLAWAMTGDRDLAAEVAQETLVTAFLGIRRLRDAAASASFAVQLPVTGQAPYRVMMARIDGRGVVVARPSDVLADELEELLREPRTMVGSVSSDAAGASMAARIR